MIRLILSNVRASEERIGDLNAQFAAIGTGIQQLMQLVEKYSPETILQVFDESLKYATRRVVASIEAIPEGKYTFEDVMDDSGVSLEPIPIKVELTVANSRIFVDFTGTGNQVPAPINSSLSMTKGAVYIILKAILDPLGPSNSGWYDLIEFNCPEGSIVNPDYDAPVFGGGIETGMRIMDCIQGALAPVLPEVVTAAPYGTIDTTFFTGKDPDTGQAWLFNDPLPGGWGAGYNHDGESAFIGIVANVKDVPIEIVELRYPLRFHRSELIEDSGGAGKNRGGLGAIHEIEILSKEAQLTIQADRTRSAPWGLFNGKPGKSTRYSLIKADGREVLLGGKMGSDYASAKKSGIVVNRGDIARIESAGGGGYGDPKDRDRKLVEKDLHDGYISKESALADYDYRE